MSAILCGRFAMSACSYPPSFINAIALSPARRQRRRLRKLNSSVFSFDSRQNVVSSLSQIPWRSYASSAKHKRPSSALPASRSTPSISSTATTSFCSDVNPPPSTLPAELDLPPPASPDATPVDQLKRYIALGRAYYSFYKTGLKNVYHNYRASLPLRRSLGLPTYLPTSPPPATSSVSAAVKSLGFSRADLQLVRRAAYDVRRMIPFTLILVLCGEFTPVVVLALGNAVTPFTCRVPRQVEKEHLAKVERTSAALTAHRAAVQGAMTPVVTGSEEEMHLLADNYADMNFADAASAEQVLRACAVFSLAKSHTRPLFLVPLVYRPRLRRWAQYLDLDDRLIQRCGGVKAMNAEEVKIAVEERGGAGVAGGKREGWDAERDERRWLEKWLGRRKLK